MRSQIRWRRQKLLLVLLTVTFLAAYFEFGLLPGKLKHSLITPTQELSGTRLEFDRLLYLPFVGLQISGLRISTPDGHPLVAAKTLTLKIPFDRLVTQKKIIVSEAYLDQPVFYSLSPNKYPLTVILTLILSKGLQAILPDTFVLEKFRINHGKMQVKSSEDTDREHETINIIDLTVQYNKKPTHYFKGTFYLGDNDYARVSFWGKWNTLNGFHEFRGKGFTKKIPPWLAHFLQKDQVEFDHVRSDFEFIVVPHNDSGYHFEISSKKTDLTLSFEERQMEGSLSLNLIGIFETKTQKITLSKGILDMETGFAGDFQDLNGRIFFNENKMHLDKLKTKWRGAPTRFDGFVDLVEPRKINLRIQQKARDLNILMVMMPKELAKQFNLQSISGELDIRANISGDANKLAVTDQDIFLNINEGRWALDQDEQTVLSNIHGKISVSDNIIHTPKLTAVLDGQPIQIEGHFDLDPSSQSHFEITHPKWNLSSEILNKKDLLNIQKLKLNFGASLMQLKGFVLKNTGNSYELDAVVDLDLDDIQKHFDLYFPGIQKMYPAGTASFKALFTGKAYENGSFIKSISAKIPRTQIFKNLTLDETDLDLSFRKEGLSVTYGRSKLYDGEIRLTGELDFKENLEGGFNLKMSCFDVDLSQISNDLELTDVHLSGLINMELGMEGVLRDDESLKGQGNFHVKDGKLFTTHMFKELRDLSFVTIVGMENVTFREAEGDFSFEEKTFYTQRTSFISPLINISLQGKIGFDRSLEVYLQSRFSRDLIKQSYELGGLAPMVLNYAEDQISEYKITGTLDDPNYTALLDDQ